MTKWLTAAEVGALLDLSAHTVRRHHVLRKHAVNIGTGSQRPRLRWVMSDLPKILLEMRQETTDA